MSTLTHWLFTIALLTALSISFAFMAQQKQSASNPIGMTTTPSANATLIDAIYQDYNREGQRQRRIQAASVIDFTQTKPFHASEQPMPSHTHSPSLDEHSMTLLTHVDYTAYDNQHPAWDIQAQQAAAPHDLSTIQLRHAVRITQHSTRPTRLYTTRLTLYPNQHRLLTTAPIRLKQPHFTLTGRGLIATLKTGHLVVPHDVNAHYQMSTASSSPNQYTQITAHHLDYQLQQHVATYRGAVQMHQGNAHLAADQVTLYWNVQKNQLTHLTAIGQPVRYSAITTPASSHSISSAHPASQNSADPSRKTTRTQNTTTTMQRFYAYANHLDLNPIQHIVRLRQHAELIRHGDHVKAPEIWYDMAQHHVRALPSTSIQHARTQQARVVINTTS